MQKLYNRIVKYILLFFIFPFLFWGQTSFAYTLFDDDLTSFEELQKQGIRFSELPNSLDVSFEGAVQELCQSVINYSLDRDFKDVHSEFHTHMNCLFNDAFSQSPTATLTQVQDLIKEDPFAVLTPPDSFHKDQCFFRDEKGNFTQTPITVENYQGHIERKEFRTQCSENGTYPSVMTPYSVCRVAEVALIEYCGYQTYLWGKMKDDDTFQKELEKQFPNKNNHTPQRWNQVKTETQNTYFQEMKRAKRTILDTLFLYQKFEQNYRIHAWYNMIIEKLKLIRETLSVLRETIDTYPLKFINATIPSP